MKTEARLYGLRFAGWEASAGSWDLVLKKVAFEGTALQVLNSSDFVLSMFLNTPCGPVKLSVKGLGFIQGLPCLGLLWAFLYGIIMYYSKRNYMEGSG